MAGEGQGPFCTTAKYSSVLIGGEDMLATDLTCVRYMGLNPNKIRYLNYFITKQNISLDQDIRVICNGMPIIPFFDAPTRYKNFDVVPQWNEIKYQVD